jgi:DNA-binding response OmpR family regulator
MITRTTFVFFVAHSAKQSSSRELYPEPDLILLELRLPRVDGFEVLEWIRRQDKKLRRIPVVVLSGPESGPRIKRALDLGAVDYFTKPLLFRDLVDLVRHELACFFRGVAVAA